MSSAKSDESIHLSAWIQKNERHLIQVGLIYESVSMTFSVIIGKWLLSCCKINTKPRHPSEQKKILESANTFLAK